jgi:hypothetical protein
MLNGESGLYVFVLFWAYHRLLGSYAERKQPDLRFTRQVSVVTGNEKAAAVQRLSRLEPMS